MVWSGACLIKTPLPPYVKLHFMPQTIHFSHIIAEIPSGFPQLLK